MGNKTHLIKGIEVEVDENSNVVSMSSGQDECYNRYETYRLYKANSGTNEQVLIENPKLWQVKKCLYGESPYSLISNN